MTIRLGTLVTLLVRKDHPDGEFLSAGVSGMIVQQNPNLDGTIRYVVDFGSEGQWNCEENELQQEGRVGRDRERETRPWPVIEEGPLIASQGEPAQETIIGYRSDTEEDDDEDDDHILSFEEEMALLENKG